ncbi:MAG: CRISPR-associated ring nuclease [Candidatus Caldatribacterium sp.]|uniref:CRISPR-associated ring nuclease n=1 Tax=Candidatus Caldatribacterium sp. TaxID=2282143 RepID=UPI00299284E4|nr:CRISPR-associated ring nuclease [Candidatus Caldatribacterium sp.]MCX7731247.1 CRISPR-associated ring nuclease [Candidatus Caldatribacterium sp.]MDW8082113.1 CRISPR-associated ring nuclease [Candidatus Calescibacterium sp.]
MLPPPEVLVATLGTEPQVVTLTLDTLIERNFSIENVFVLHLNPSLPALRASLEKLEKEASWYSMPFTFVPIRDKEHFPEDFLTEEDAGLFLRVLYRTVADLKRKRLRIHLSIAGGRKIMAALSMVVAQLLFDEDDHVWHLLSEGRLLAEKTMHPEDPSQVVLVPIPVLQWSLFPSTAREILLWDDPYRAIAKQRELRDLERFRFLELFWEKLTPAEQELAKALIQVGGTQEVLAKKLRRSRKTVSNQLCSIYAKYRDHFGFGEGVKVRDLLIRDLGMLFARIGSSP